MNATLFSLVVAENSDLIFGYGMEIVSYSGRDEPNGTRRAIVYIDSPNGEGSISTHASAEAACRRWSTIVPLSIEWDVDAWADAYRQLSDFRS